MGSRGEVSIVLEQWHHELAPSVDALRRAVPAHLAVQHEHLVAGAPLVLLDDEHHEERE